ncbi:MAG: hypothetical protein M3Z96_03550 [Pseudomonadota bacterium]|nr:hypothetical protein [Pseudomonadota bacterium]
MANKLPGAIIVIAVLRDHFLTSEKKILKSFVTWARRLNPLGEPTNPVLLMTSHELFMDHFILATWEKLGEPHKSFANYETTRNLQNFTDATQRIYLDMASFYAWRDAQYRKRAALKQKDLKAPVDTQRA